jgi:carnitine-CoA ligase
MSSHLDPRMPNREHCVLRDMLEHQAGARPEQIFAVFSSAHAWTYRQMRELTVRTANGLRKLGVQQGDHVLSWLPNGPEALRLWFALNYLGAVYVPVNLAYRGRLLEHVIENAGARLMIAHADLYPRLADIQRGNLQQLVAIGAGSDAENKALEGLAIHSAAVLDDADTELPALARPIEPWDTQTIIYTSGTTGPSKGVLSSYMHLYSMSSSLLDLDDSDRFFITLPFFHVGGTMPTYKMLAVGGSLVINPHFNTQTFWSTVRNTQATAAILLGAMVGFLMRQPEQPDDTAHGLRNVTIVPFSELAQQFRQRFGCDIYTHFNMTEISMPLRTTRNAEAIGSCGRPRPGVELRIVDANDCEVEASAIGELVVRTESPWAMNHGYNNNAEATVRAWRNGWFHTGDAFRVDARGEYFFVDRLKDAIRRRGENISSFEIECEVSAHPLIREVAAFALPSSEGEDDVAVAIALCDGAALDPIELIAFLVPRMAHFMIPRYVRFVDELPKTPTQKVQKNILRELGLSGTVWDREQAGIKVQRQKIP